MVGFITDRRTRARRCSQQHKERRQERGITPTSRAMGEQDRNGGEKRTLSHTGRGYATREGESNKENDNRENGNQIKRGEMIASSKPKQREDSAGTSK